MGFGILIVKKFKLLENVPAALSEVRKPRDPPRGGPVVSACRHDSRLRLLHNVGGGFALDLIAVVQAYP